MREFPTTGAPKPGSEQSLDNLNSYSDKLLPAVEKKQQQKKKPWFPDLHRLVWQNVSCFTQEAAALTPPGQPVIRLRAKQRRPVTVPALGLLLGECFSFLSYEPHLVPFGHPPGHDQLDRAALVPLRRHGLAQRLHGVLVGFSQQRLSVDGDQLVVDPKPSVLS